MSAHGAAQPGHNQIKQFVVRIKARIGEFVCEGFYLLAKNWLPHIPQCTGANFTNACGVIVSADLNVSGLGLISRRFMMCLIKINAIGVWG